MNKEASITIHGHAGPGVAENMMSGRVHVTGNCSQGAGASGRGGMLVIDGDASSRCGISMKGIAIVVKGSVGHLSAFMGQTGSLSSAATAAVTSAIRSMRRASTCAARWPAWARTASKSG